MIVWVLYFLIEGHSIDHPYRFSFKETCDNLGKIMVKDHKYEGYRCVKEIMED
jgi:hypothetical protein